MHPSAEIVRVEACCGLCADRGDVRVCIEHSEPFAAVSKFKVRK